MGMKDEDLAGLSDEEIAALNDDDDESEILKGIAGDVDDNGDDEGEADDGNAAAADDAAGGADDGAGDGKAAAGDPPNADPDKGGEPAPEPTTVVVDEFQAEFTATPPEDLAEKLAALDTRVDELMAKFKDGEIEMADVLKETRAIDAERLQLTMAAEQAKWAEQQNADSRAQRWKWEQERFFGQDKAAIYKDDPITLAALNASVKQLAADPANDRRPPGWFLEEADRRVRERFNLGGGAKPPSEGDGKPKPAPREPDLSKVPKTLANLPAAEMPETGADEFAYLEKLDGIALEQALRKLTPEQEARYLGAAA